VEVTGAVPLANLDKFFIMLILYVVIMPLLRLGISICMRIQIILNSITILGIK